MAYEKLVSGFELSIDEVQGLFSQLLVGDLAPAQVAAVLGVLASRQIRIEELLGARCAIRALCEVREKSIPDAIDVCGTGGDGKNTFNISTCVAFVLAGCGVKVIKNGNYSASSQCGSSNVLEALGIKFPQGEVELSVCLNRQKAVFLHAPYLYPALRTIAPIRKELKIRTIFNLLGPLLNPVLTGAQVIGVPNRTIQRLFGEALNRLQRKYAVITTDDGYDEISLTSNIQVVSHRGHFQFSPDDFGFSILRKEELELHGGVEKAAAIIRDILGNGVEINKKNVVAANAGLALWLLERGENLRECTKQALFSIESGAALGVLNELT